MEKIVLKTQEKQRLLTFFETLIQIDRRQSKTLTQDDYSKRSVQDEL